MWRLLILLSFIRLSVSPSVDHYPLAELASRGDRLNDRQFLEVALKNCQG